MNEPMATMFVFAGITAAEKSTIRNLIIDRLGVSVNIDPDALTRGIDSENPERSKVSAGKDAIKLVRECILHRRDFTVETTLVRWQCHSPNAWSEMASKSLCFM
ncbi:hypothetical protein PALU110988_09470 [Paenibacillus lupini]|nr:putative ABC-type ATPase [Paenibacillus lupini]